MTNAYDKLPGRPDPADLVVEVPAFEDDRPQPEPTPPAAAPELVAATEFAVSSHAPPTIRRTQMRTGAWIAGVPIAALVVVAIVQILLPADRESWHAPGPADDGTGTGRRPDRQTIDQRRAPSRASATERTQAGSCPSKTTRRVTTAEMGTRS